MVFAAAAVVVTVCCVAVAIVLVGFVGSVTVNSAKASPLNFHCCRKEVVVAAMYVPWFCPCRCVFGVSYTVIAGHRCVPLLPLS